MRPEVYSNADLTGNPYATLFRRQSSSTSKYTISELADEGRYFLKLGIGKPTVLKAAVEAGRNGTTLAQELVAIGSLAEETYYETLAEKLNLPYFFKIDPAAVQLTPMIDSQLVAGPIIRANRPDGPPLLVFSPQARDVESLKQTFRDHPARAARLAVASPSVIRQAVWFAGRHERIGRSSGQLFNQMQHFSARIVLSGGQGLFFGMGIVAIVVAFLLFTAETLIFFHLVLTVFFWLALFLRAIALHEIGENHIRRRKLPEPDGSLPVYTVLVALYQEKEMLEQLVAALNRLDWPPALLDIKLVCEADDFATIAAAKQVAKGCQFEIVEVPPGGPRTKPNALSYALCAARGEFLVIYDAEDRPHPGQLREAYRHFRSSDEDLACLQAPLEISNGTGGWISALFSVEYAALFRGLLPLLAQYRLPMPLGGTSNHFRVDALKRSGGWDPYNVTEDADLGLRLHRLGYYCGVLSLPTLEDAPTQWRVWRNQRCRWFKGWMQTLLVHFRNPVVLLKQIRTHGMLAIALTTGGMLFSALVHPFILYFVFKGAWSLFVAGSAQITLWQTALFIADLANIVGSYTLFVLLGRKAMNAEERQKLGRVWLKVPLYWLMLSASAWGAAMELYRKPFHWRKTPHKSLIRT